MKIVLCSLIIVLTGCAHGSGHTLGSSLKIFGDSLIDHSSQTPVTNNIPTIQPYQSIYPTSSSPTAKTCVTQFGQTRCSQ